MAHDVYPPAARNRAAYPTANYNTSDRVTCQRCNVSDLETVLNPPTHRG